MTTSALVYEASCCLFHYKNYLFPSIAPRTMLPQLIIFSFLESDWPAEKVIKTPMGGNLHNQLLPIPVYFLSALTEAYSLLVYLIISRCPIDRIQVVSDSVIGTGVLWPASRICSDLTVQRLLRMFENHLELKKDRIYARIFTRILCFIQTSFQVGTQMFFIKLN